MDERPFRDTARVLPMSLWERRLRVAAWLLGIISILLIVIPLLWFTDAQWANEQLVSPIWDLAFVLLMIDAPLWVLHGARLFLRQPNASSFLRELHSWKLFVIGVAGLLILFEWYLVLNLQNGAYGEYAYLPASASPVGILCLVLVALSGVLFFVEIFLIATRNSRRSKSDATYDNGQAPLEENHRQR